MHVAPTAARSKPGGYEKDRKRDREQVGGRGIGSLDH